MEGRMKATGATRLAWSLVLGLGLALGLLWALTPHHTVEAQAINPGFTVDLTHDVIPDRVDSGDTIPTRSSAGVPPAFAPAPPWTSVIAATPAATATS